MTLSEEDQHCLAVIDLTLRWLSRPGSVIQSFADLGCRDGAGPAVIPTQRESGCGSGSAEGQGHSHHCEWPGGTCYGDGGADGAGYSRGASGSGSGSGVSMGRGTREGGRYNPTYQHTGHETLTWSWLFLGLPDQ